jgi:nucleoside-diphosphate-sugar epimerase
VLVLGAGGFIGRALVARLAQAGVPVVPAGRGAGGGNLTAASDWPALLAGCRAAVYLASRAHAPAGDDDWIAAEAATAAALAAAARRAGLERLVLMSSLKVQGEDSGAGRLSAGDPPAPADAYGRAKLRIEAAMGQAAADILVVLRPPLVYGPGVKANFLALLRLVDRGVPLPLGSIANRRSLIFLDNLIDLVLCALDHEEAAGGTFLMRDDDEVTTPGLVREIARQLDRPARLFPCPPGLLRTAARLAGRGDAALRLLGSLSVDDTPTRERLGWRPRVALADGIAATCRWFREQS